MMKKILFTALAFTALSGASYAQTTTLFDGKTTKGWHAYLKTDAGAWSAVDGTLKLDPKAPNQGDLITDGEYENFELTLDWNISEGGNSGIIFSVHEDPAFGATYDTGIEMQVLDNIKAEDNKKASHLAGSLYDMYTPSASVAKPAGEWNKVKIKKDHGHLIFWLNGTKIVETQMGSPEWADLIDKSKYKTWKDWAKYPKGHIALQDHGAVIAFRNIKIKTL